MQHLKLNFIDLINFGELEIVFHIIMEIQRIF